MSVFEVECAARESGIISEHVRKYYKNITGDPAVFCFINDDDLPINAEAVIIPTEPDPCHRNLNGFSNSGIKKYFRQWRNWQRFYICDGDEYRPLTEDDIAAFKKAV